METNGTKPEISINLALAICEALSLVPTHVKEIRISPTEGTATLYRLDENGQKFIEFSPEGHAPATETLDFVVVPA